MNSVLPAEWKMHKATWLAWPDLPDEWKEDQEGARSEFLTLCRVIGVSGPAPREALKIFTKSDRERRRVSEELSNLPVRCYDFEYGDIWLRDTGCLFEGKGKAHVFRFNGWGGKYIMGKDTALAAEMARLAEREQVDHPFILEGGALEHNGRGLFFTTEQCLLNANRNVGMTKSDYENRLSGLGAEKVLWITEGLLGDHTDGHIDNILRFVNEKVLLCMEPCGKLDPQFEVLKKILNEATAFASRHELELQTIKSPGEVKNRNGDLMPASYMNFYIANNAVAVPVYGRPQDEEAVEMLQRFFPARKVVGVPSNHILTGGGSFHCITQQEPL